jgi:hypothetical protein
VASAELGGPPRRERPLHRVLLVLSVLGAIAVAGSTGLAIAPAAADSLSFQPVLGLPASDVAVIGASPGDSTGETWAQGEIGAVPAFAGGQSLSETQTLLRYTASSGAWQPVPVDNQQGEPLSFKWWGSEVTDDGGVVLAGDSIGSGESTHQGLVLHDPGSAFALAPTPGSSGEDAVLAPDEQLFPGQSHSGSSDAPIMAALDEGAGHTGALIAPVAAEGVGTEGSKTEGSKGERGKTEEGSGEGTKGAESGKPEVFTPRGPGILHYDGSSWTREQICESYAAEKCTAPTGKLTPLALSASSPANAWLAASTSTEPLVLFQRVREASGEEVWVKRTPSSWLLGSGSAPLSGEHTTPVSGGPLLTAVGQGVWVDVQLSAGSSTGDGTVFVSPGAGGEVGGSWCYPTSLCPGDSSLGAPLTSDYGSFAWSGSGSGPGRRVISGLPDGVLLVLGEGQSEFAYTIAGGAGGASGAIGPGGVTLGQLPDSGSAAPTGGAAFSSPEEGWLGAGSAPSVIHVTVSPSADALTSWPVPFRRPLLAIAAQPGTTPGEASAQALAVGADGEIARYMPGEGWTPEYLYNSAGERETPNLRGVAWPEAGRAYAVGDEGAMWLWQSSTGLWSSDPAEPPGFDGQLTAIAFSPTNPSVGYAVGKQGVLLSYDKTWIQEPLPAGLTQANFTSVAFAGGEAIATYRMLNTGDTPGEIGTGEVGGLIVNDGSGWQVDPSAQALLSKLSPQDTVLSKVAGLPNGGAVAAGPGVVMERDSATSEWHFSGQPLPEAQNISALAAIQEGSSVRALVSLDTAGQDNPSQGLLYQEIDNPPGPALGQYGVLLGADPLPVHGYLLREDTEGWKDEQHDAYPAPSGADLPGWPDAVLALLVGPSGEGGWAVGGQTGGELTLYGLKGTQEAAQTAGVMRYGAGPAPSQSTSSAISIPEGEVTFAVGGDAQCNSPCADLANEDIGPDAWLSGAISRAGQIPGVRGFLYTGARIDDSPDVKELTAEAFSRELQDYARVLGTAGSLPVYAAISPSDIPSGGTSAPFVEALGSHAPAGSVPSGTPAPPKGTAAYVFESPGSGGTVRVIVLDYSQPELSPDDTSQPSCPGEGAEPANQLQWLCAQLRDARDSGIATIVMGSANITEANAVNYAKDAQAVGQVLVEQGASAYLFESPEENVSDTIGSSSIPAYGTGTLGYVGPPLNDPDDFLGASGFMLVSVNASQRNTEDVAHTSVTLTPSIGQLGLNATDGTFLRRSQVALFEGLARRPLGGVERMEDYGAITSEPPEPYTPIPESCVGSNCAKFIAPSYSFTSSQTDVGNFVEPNPTNPLEVLQVNGKPVPDSASGLFCAFNAGTTTVTITVGGLSYSEPVTVQAGSVEQPCGTVPLVNPPEPEATQTTATVAPPPPPLAPSPTPAPHPFLSLSAPPTPVAATPVVHHASPPPPLLPLIFPAVPPTPARAAVPAPVPQAARPAPPSGTSEVSQPVGASEKEREAEGAVDVVHNAAAYEPGGNSLPPWSPLALILIAAAAGTGMRRRRTGRRPAFARAQSVSDRHRRNR